MNLPFTPGQFFEVFAAYNVAVWPAPVALNVLALALVVLVLGAPRIAGRLVAYALAFLWLWLAVAYHLAFFWRINPAAPFFAIISLASAAAFAWFGGVKGVLQFEPGVRARGVVGLVVVVFALVLYPIIGLYLGHQYPASPTFGLPCPTTLFTFGVLLMATRTLPKIILIGPLICAVIGSAAAFALGVIEDLALVVIVVFGMHMLLRRAPPTTPPQQPAVRRVVHGVASDRRK